ncbi:DUF1217 domain-containing protein [Skermanella mucosa]|uniref:DUF1217 domain-containing protein n=1 Tax=Skermanella mucosa TaxID=1789672 RepID=UPI00192B1072|nr:DUF1217 domain-containing protein [Skermanella mucosa]UEM20221.1 DUF1217 domain-containing protein [Skermanella mucosa]
MSSSLVFAKMPAIAAYKLALKQGDAALEKMADRKDVKAEVDYFNKNIQSVKSVDDLFKDRRMIQFVLDAVDLGKETGKMGLIKKVLTQKADDPDALMNKLVDKRFKTAASLLKLGENGLGTIQRESTKADLAELYVKNKYDAGLASQNSAVPLALYFKENASSVKNTYEILGDQRMRHVVTTALGLPLQLANQSVEAQAAAIEKRLKLSDLKDEKFVDKLAQRFLMASDDGSSATGANSYVLNLFA